ncbi:SGNH/GDSL hydrolase family protein [Nocardia sp. alder85J]|uniref:SGNH/GDSL hydrolase family protein n=1 Tax=Nocardia sp. alder85J TaxID=2862949 RepID=UPI001CD42CA2|nr:SGNH/GDSL hydrolase family protein [Nocardia sp. alder85J]MCX4098563.1 SGNH/GDSL hydrolase family protein [Nocardia sp. alder85J]
MQVGFPRAALTVVASTIAVALTGFAGAGAEPPPTPPASGAEVVVMGDSYTANGTYVGLGLTPYLATAQSCPHSPTSWPTQLEHRIGPEQGGVTDVSCLGASLNTPPTRTALYETKAAAASGAFGPGTRLVAIQLGLNDTWGAHRGTLDSLPECMLGLAGCGPGAGADPAADPAAVTGADYADRLRVIIDYVRYYAPGARIVLVGYPEIHAPGSEAVCVDVLGARVTQPQAAGITSYLDRLDIAQRDAAELLGIDFFDTRAVTAGHDACSADPWINGFLDPRGEWLGLTLHPTVRGDAAVAAALDRWLDDHAPRP